MRLSDYLKNRAACYAIWAFALALALLFLYVFNVSWHAMAIASALLVVGSVVSELVEYIRRKAFYDGLYEAIDGLQVHSQAYLASEMVEPPDFLEGQVLCDVMRMASSSMNARVARHRRESQDFREFIELWVHEVKLPLASLQLMSHNDGNARYAQQLARIDDMVQNVLYYARSESAEKDYVIRETSLARAFSNVALKNRDELLERGVQLRTEGLDVTVMTDGKWLEYMLGQLMANSLKYAAPDRPPQIRVAAEEQDDRTVLRFWDNGIGIPVSDLPHVFEKSFTGENGRMGKNSTGMGLYLIRKLCRRLGHEVVAASVQGEWTEVIISFGKNALLDLV